MRAISCGLLLMTTMLVGCGSSLHDATAPGPVDQSLYYKATLDNEQRLAGEDKRVVALYKTPVKAVAIGYDALVSEPFLYFWRWCFHDTAHEASRLEADPDSADNRREGVLRMTDFGFARKGPSIFLYA